MPPNYGGDTLGSILGPVGSHWVQKMGLNRSYGYGAKSRWEPPGSILGPMGPIGSKKWVNTVKNYHAPKFEFSTTPRSSIFPNKWKLGL